ncbi:MAG: DUF3793 family protein [Hungatella sp.]|nr:DUF3793 family protein [Hungatella sp.]
MMEELIVQHCSPTMAGLKTGNLFSCQVKDKDALLSELRQVNKRFSSRGIRLIPMKYQEDRMLLYMYRPAKLKADLADETAKKILTAKSYPVSQSDRCVVHLIHCLNHETDFPHEIGLFLGYPPTDVDAFMKNGAAKAKYTGIWNVYDNVEAAKCQFARFKKCTRIYCEVFRKYHSFDRLIVGCSVASGRGEAPCTFSDKPKETLRIFF